MADKLADEVNSLQINDPGGDSNGQNTKDDIESKWLFPLGELYKLALHFYKGTSQFLNCFRESNLFLTYSQLPVHVFSLKYLGFVPCRDMRMYHRQCTTMEEWCYISWVVSTLL